MEEFNCNCCGMPRHQCGDSTWYSREYICDECDLMINLDYKAQFEWLIYEQRYEKDKWIYCGGMPLRDFLLGDICGVSYEEYKDFPDNLFGAILEYFNDTYLEHSDESAQMRVKLRDFVSNNLDEYCEWYCEKWAHGELDDEGHLKNDE